MLNEFTVVMIAFLITCCMAMFGIIYPPGGKSSEGLFSSKIPQTTEAVRPYR